MKIILQRTRRKKTESGFYFNENPQIINLVHEFPNVTKTKGCACPGVSGHLQKLHVATIPFGKYYSECDKISNPCIPDNALTYEDGVYSEIARSCEKCK